MVSDVAVGHTLVNTVVADRARRDLAERAARHDLVGARDAERRKETHYWDRGAGTKFVPFALETYGALSDRSDRFLVKCATLASRESAGSGCGKTYQLPTQLNSERLALTHYYSLLTHSHSLLTHSHCHGNFSENSLTKSSFKNLVNQHRTRKRTYTHCVRKSRVPSQMSELVLSSSPQYLQMTNNPRFTERVI